MNGFSGLFSPAAKFYSPVDLFDLYGIAFDQEGFLGNEFIAGIVFAPVFDRDGLFIQGRRDQVKGLSERLSGIDPIFHQGTYAFFLRDVTDFTFSECDTNIVMDDVSLGMMISVFTVDEFIF